jgi:hypothetical protein
MKQESSSEDTSFLPRLTWSTRVGFTWSEPGTYCVWGDMDGAYARGDNYSIELENGIARCRVWKMPELSSLAGAELAQEKIRHVTALSRSGVAKGMLFDLTEAPSIVGPKTETALKAMLDAWEARSLPVAVVAGPSALQRMQAGRLVASAAPHWGAVFVDLAQGLAWLESKR